jgi:ankyrin repeat protein
MQFVIPIFQTKEQSALHLAVAGGHKEVVETLVEAGASPTDEDAVSEFYF